MKPLAIAALLCISTSVSAQKPAVYPAHGQSSDMQAQDKGACYLWAKQTTGIDPTAVASAPRPQGPTGARVAGAARGAAAGAIIGDVSNNDAGHGTAVGNHGGRARGRRAKPSSTRRRRRPRRRVSRTNAMNTYWHAYGACMQGRDYIV